MGSDEALTASHALGVLCDAFPSRSWIGSRALRPGVGGATRSSWTISTLTTWPACANRSRPPEPGFCTPAVLARVQPDYEVDHHEHVRREHRRAPRH